jgi:hypothetical protein
MIEWIDVEDNEEVIEDDVMEALEELERVAEAVDSDEEDPMGGNSNDEEEEDEDPLISSIQATSYLHKLRRYGRSVGLTEDVDIVQKMSTLFSLMVMNGVLPVLVRQK